MSEDKKNKGGGAESTGTEQKSEPTKATIEKAAKEKADKAAKEKAEKEAAEKTKGPKIGDTVLFFNTDGEESAAVVTKVRENNVVNLQVFRDVRSIAPVTSVPHGKQKLSVPYWEER